jgi:hypothetical protein
MSENNPTYSVQKNKTITIDGNIDNVNFQGVVNIIVNGNIINSNIKATNVQAILIDSTNVQATNIKATIIKK